jgi:hypothetical protein
MLALLWNLSAAIRGYLRFYMPTNRALDWLRTPRGLTWAIPVAFVAMPGYLYAMSVAALFAQRPGLGYLNLMVLLFAWNAMKFAAFGLVSIPMLALAVVVRWRRLAARPVSPAATEISAPSVASSNVIARSQIRGFQRSDG